MRVLLSGHNGYIGSVATRVLEEAGHTVVGLDAGYYADCTLPGTEEPTRLTIRRDIRDLTTADLVGCEAVVHLAALSNDPLGELMPQWTDDINCQAAIRLARLARQAGTRRFVFSSSCSVYGASAGETPVDEATEPKPLTAYARSKVKAERAIACLADHTFSPVFLRNATAYGVSARLRADLVLNNLVGWAWTTGAVRLMSDGSAWRPLVHVEDIAQAFVAVLAADRTVIHNQIFNVGRAKENYRVRELAMLVAEVVPGAQVEFAPGSTADQRSYQADFTKISSRLPQWQPSWDARRGAEELYEAFQVARLTEAEFTGHRYIRLKHLQYLLAEEQLDPSLRWRVAERAVLGVTGSV